MDGRLDGLRVGVLEEGFAESEADVESTVRKAARRLEEAGACVEGVSVPMHADGG